MGGPRPRPAPPPPRPGDPAAPPPSACTVSPPPSVAILQPGKAACVKAATHIEEEQRLEPHSQLGNNIRYGMPDITQTSRIRGRRTPKSLKERHRHHRRRLRLSSYNTVRTTIPEIDTLTDLAEDMLKFSKLFRVSPFSPLPPEPLRASIRNTTMLKEKPHNLVLIWSTHLEQHNNERLFCCSFPSHFLPPFPPTKPAVCTKARASLHDFAEYIR